jgi:hypothetical protein
MRVAAVWTLNAILAVSLGALVALAQRDVAPPPAIPVPVAAAAPTATPAPAATPAPRRSKPRRVAGHSTRAALRRALAAGAISPAAYRRWLGVERRARTWLRRLHGSRRAELASVASVVNDLAASRRLTASRMPLAFLTLKRNTTVWKRASLPRPGQRMTFGSDPAVFQYYAGRGVQYHALASAGRINALVHPCLRAVRSKRFPARCFTGRLRRMLDSLARLSSRRGGFVAFEYQFAFGQGSPLWISAMAQATAAQALARGARVFASPRYRRLAIGALGAFEAPAPLGVRSGDEYLMYSFAPSLHIINGFLQSLIGLHDVAALTGSARARRLFRRGERVARRTVADYDTGAWSLYSAAGRESPLGYHQLVTGFLRGMCDRTGDAPYCETGRRFEHYLHRPPRLLLAAPTTRLARFRLDKGSTVRLTLRGPRLRFHNTFAASRGLTKIGFRAKRPGRYLVRVQATGPEGRTVARRAYVRVKRRKTSSKGRSRSRRSTRSTRHPAR